MSDKYILKDGVPVREPNLIAWATWFQTAERFVAQTIVGPSRISTVFLGIDHNFGSSGPPVLWETMVFGGTLDQEQDRCSGSREQAEAMHAKMVERVKATPEPKSAH